MERLIEIQKQGVDIGFSRVLTPNEEEEARIDFCAIVGMPESATWLELYYAMIPKSSKVGKIPDNATGFQFSEVIDDPDLTPETPMRLIYVTWNESYVVPLRILDLDVLWILWRASADALYLAPFGTEWLLFLSDAGDLYFLRKKKDDHAT